MSEKKELSLEAFQKSINKEFSKGLDRDVAQMGDDVEEVQVICSSGTLTLDVAIGIGGLPRGRMIEVYGPPSGGKTLLTLLSIIEAQKQGMNCSFIDVENSFDKRWFKALGGDLEKLVVVTPDSGPMAFEVMEKIAKAGIIDLVIIDSVSAMVTEAQIEGGYGDAHMAQLARLMSQGCAKLNQVMVNYKHCTFMFINQIRSKMKTNKFGGEVTDTSGGKGLDFYASVRLEVKRGDVIGDKDDPEGFRTKIIVRKNKVGPPMRKVEVSLYIGKNGKYGADVNEEIVDVAIGLNVIEKMSKDKTTKELIADENGAWYRIEEGVEFYGRPKLIEYIQANPESVEKLKTTVFAFMSHKIKPSEGSFDDKMNKKERKKRGVKESDTKGESETAVSEDM